MDVAAIAVTDLRVRRGGRDVLHGLTFSIPRGSITGLLGPSGCGKTTLMRAVVGAQEHVQGHVRVLGESPGSSAARRRVGYVTQQPAVYADLTVKMNLRYFADVLGAARPRVGAVMDAVGLTAHADQQVSTLSGGQRARVSLATALLNEPELLVLDEPTVGLDPVLRRDLWRLFERLRAHGVTLLVSSHVMDEASRCSSLLLMRDGHLVASGTPQELLSRTGTSNIDDAFLVLATTTEPALAAAGAR